MKKKKTVCWRCKKAVRPSWIFCPHCAVKLRDTRTKSSPIRPREIGFLNDLYSFGWYNHGVTSTIAFEDMRDIQRYYPSSNRDDFAESDYPMLNIEPDRAQKILRAKIFADYMALLESFGFLCIAIRNRRKTSILWSYMNTEPQEVTQFYNQIRAYRTPPSLTKLLKLPSSSQITDAVRAMPSDLFGKEPNLNDDYRELPQRLQIVAEMYTANSSANVRIYNKIKHGFCAIEGEGWVNPPILDEELAILVDEDGLVARLPMTDERVLMELENIRTVTAIGAEFLALCIALDRINLLFD